MGTITYDGSTIAESTYFEYTSNSVPIANGTDFRIGFATSAGSHVWDNITIRQDGEITVNETFNDGIWDGSDFELAGAGQDLASANSGSYSSGDFDPSGSRAVLRTTSNWVPALDRPVTIEASMLADGSVSGINFLYFQGSATPSANPWEANDSRRIRIHNFIDGGTNFHPDQDWVKPGNEFIRSPLKITIIDYGNYYTARFKKQPLPEITSASYDAKTGNLTVSGSNFVSFDGSNNDIDVSSITLHGKDGNSFGLTNVDDVEITDDSSFTVQLRPEDQNQLRGYCLMKMELLQNGTSYC